MPKVERSITINAPVEKVFTYINDPELNPEWLPSMIEVKDVNITEEGVGSHFKWVYKMAGIPFNGETTTIEHVPNQRIVVQSKVGIKSTWSWTFEPVDNGTRLSLVLEYTIPVPVLGKLAEAVVSKQNEKEADAAMANIKAKMES